MDKIYKIDLAVIFISVFALMFLVGYVNPQVISPIDGYETSETNVLFSIEKADKLLIDDNIEFTTPEEYFIEDGLKINIVPGTYYWKAVGVLGSEIRTLTINSEVVLEIKEGDDGFEVVNSGNVRLNVDVYNGTGIVKKVKLDVSDGVELDGNKFAGSYDE